jgi:cytochrome bd-type quinol oxidase subunit 2
MVVLHGSAFLSVKVEPGPVHDRTRQIGLWAGLASLALFAIGGVWVTIGRHRLPHHQRDPARRPVQPAAHHQRRPGGAC